MLWVLGLGVFVGSEVLVTRCGFVWVWHLILVGEGLCNGEFSALGCVVCFRCC